MAVITITRQYGAGGSLVAQLVAERLRWTVIDNEFVSEVAKRAGLPPEDVAAREERAPSLLERLAAALALAAPEMVGPAAQVEEAEADEPRLIRITEHVIGEAAAQGRVVLVGRGASAYLGTAGEGAHALHVYVVAPTAARVRAVMERQSQSESEATRAIHEIDAARERYLERYYRRRRDAASNYHLAVNTAWLGYDGAADLIVELARRRGMA